MTDLKPMTHGGNKGPDDKDVHVLEIAKDVFFSARVVSLQLDIDALKTPTDFPLYKSPPILMTSPR